MTQDTPSGFDPSRRQFLAGAATLAIAASGFPHFAWATPSADATTLGVVPDAARDQGPAITHALEQATAEGKALHLPPGRYAAADISVPPGGRLTGSRGRSVLLGLGDAPILSAGGTPDISIGGLTFDGREAGSGGSNGHVEFEACERLHIAGCTFTAGDDPLLHAHACSGVIEGNRFEKGLSSALFAIDSTGLRIAGNDVRDMADNGILVWRSTTGEDGTLITENRIARIGNRSGGDGQWGNGINVFRAGNVITANNRITDCALSAVRYNSGSNAQIIGNNATRIGETALYAEFGFSGAVIADNIVDRAATGISVTNYNDGGRLATVTGNVIRDLFRDDTRTQSPWAPGVGISVEADTMVANNVVENAPWTGIAIGYGRYLNDVMASGNIVRNARYGIGVSVVDGAGSAVIRDNLITGSKVAAIAGFDHDEAITGDIKDDAGGFAHLQITGNRTG